MASKRKVTVTLDEDLVRELEQVGNVSAQLNDAGWVLVERRRSAQRLAALLDELDRSDGESASLDARDTDRALGRIVGGVLTGAGARSTMIVDAHVVAVAVEAGGGVLVTGEPDDLERLSAPYANIVVEAV
jgi:hypothetical protein